MKQLESRSELQISNQRSVKKIDLNKALRKEIIKLKIA